MGRRVFAAVTALSVGLPLALGGWAGLAARVVSPVAPRPVVSTGPASRRLPRAVAGLADPAGKPALTAAASSPTVELYLTIVTGDMTGHDEYPAYVPSDFTLPANATVVVTITNFDDATALPKGMAGYAVASGIDGGTMSVTPIDPGTPNAANGKTKIVDRLDPETGVSHTFTIPALGINVPVAPHARTVFTVHTGAPGSFYWRCFDPCGAGKTGWGTAMAARSGFMQGTLTVA